jgi:hypothetical protein
MMIEYFAPSYLIGKFLNNRVLGLVISLALVAIAMIVIGVWRKYFTQSSERATFLWVLIGAALLSAWTFFRPLSLTVLPDALIGLFAIWALFSLRQTVSIAVIVPLLLFTYYLFFSPMRLDIEFDNRYWTSLKPFIYLVIFFGVTGLRVQWPIRQIAYGVVIAYPLLLVWNIALWWARDGFFMTRPNFLFENNFEVPFLLYCFVIIAFIYRDKDLRIYLLVAISVLLTGSRSGLASFMAVSVFYLLSLERKKIVWVGSAIVGVLAYMIFIRGVSSFNAGKIDQIDRLKTFMGLLSFYDFRFSEILRYPLGVGIFQKIPLGICNKMEGYADWFTGNFFNCDPIMLQSFVARALYQFGIYVLVLIPTLYLYEMTKRMGFYMAALLLTPILLTSFSVGGFSNGLSFGGLVLAILAYTQNVIQQPVALGNASSSRVALPH